MRAGCPAEPSRVRWDTPLLAEALREVVLRDFTGKRTS
jgi:hypothetical protein